MNLGFLPARLFVCVSQEEFDALGRKFTKGPCEEHGPWLTPGSDGTTHMCDSPVAESRLVVICVDTSEQDFARLAEICAHEATHAVQCIEEVMAEDQPGREYPAYLLGRITKFAVEQCLPLMHKQTKIKLEKKDD